MVHAAQTTATRRTRAADRALGRRTAAPIRASLAIILTHPNKEVRELNDAARDRLERQANWARK